jgi:TM2 domain-containing membrane protein YozV
MHRRVVFARTGPKLMHHPFLTVVFFLFFAGFHGVEQFWLVRIGW